MISRRRYAIAALLIVLVIAGAGLAVSTIQSALKGRASAEWIITEPLISASDTSLPIYVSETRCDGGDGLKPSRIRSSVDYESDRILVTVWVTPLSGMQSCVGVLSCGRGPACTNFVVRLDQPIGNRDIYDGEPSPARQLTRDEKRLP